MRRREFIIFLSGAAAACPIIARAQQGERMRLIGALLPIAKDDPDYQPWLNAFRQALQELGWVDGRNMRMDIHWATANQAEIRRQAAELVALAPDVIVAPGNNVVGALMQVTRTVPIVFPIIADPVAGGFVDSLARPGGNATGFMLRHVRFHRTFQVHLRMSPLEHQRRAVAAPALRCLRAEAAH
jgi:putative ABC transport system substrate-binding protein